MLFLSLYKCNLKTILRGLSLLWLLFLLGIVWACSIFTLFFSSLVLIYYLLFPCINPKFHCQLLLLLQGPQFSNFFIKNYPLSSLTFPLFRINDRLCFCVVSKGCVYVIYISVYCFKFFQVNFVRMFYTCPKIIEFTIYSLVNKVVP